MYCKACACRIELERLEVLPDTKVCASCAQQLNLVKPRKGIMVFDHKTGGTLQTMSADFYDKNKKYFVANGARSVVKNFSKSICA